MAGKENKSLMPPPSERIFIMDDPEVRERLERFDYIPHSVVLGMKCVEITHNQAVGRLPYHEKLIGNIETGAVHTGVLISFFDSIAGLAVMCALPRMEAFATLDLRIDCFKPSTAQKTLYCHAECNRLTRTVAFVRGTVYQEEKENAVAGGIASFFRTGLSQSNKGPL